MLLLGGQGEPEIWREMGQQVGTGELVLCVFFGMCMSINYVCVCVYVCMCVCVYVCMCVYVCIWESFREKGPSVYYKKA